MRGPLRRRFGFRQSIRPRAAAHRGTVVALAIAIVVSMMATPVLASAPGGAALSAGSSGGTGALAPAGGVETTASVGQPVVAPRAGPRRSLHEALQVVREMNTPTNATEKHRQNATHYYDLAVGQYADPVDPAGRPTLENSSLGTQELAETIQTWGENETNATQLTKIRNGSSLAVTSGNATARWQLERARLTITYHWNNLTSAQRDRLGNELDAAETAYQAGVDKQAEARPLVNSSDLYDVKEGVYERGRAIGKYGTAWEEATDVIDIADGYDAVTNTTDSDGDGLIDRRELALGTNVSDNDSDGDGLADGLETAGGYPVDSDGDGTLDANSQDSDGDDLIDRIEGKRDTDGDGIRNFRDRDDDNDSIPTEQEVEDGLEFQSDVDYDGVPNWLDRDSDGDGSLDAVEGAADEDGDGVPAYLDNDRDNDGLPDFYERNVTNTDPAQNDSDAPSTATNESDNGVLDGTEDFDGDGLPTVVEYRIGTDPFDNDTDGDGLTDLFEYNIGQFDPTVADTDGDGVSDGAEDPDADGLNVTREVELGTAPLDADTDSDGLPDGAEVANGTDPTLPDTDGDDLSDAVEQRAPFETDPTDPDTDDDGVEDGDETFTTVRRDNTTGVTVSASGPGNVAAGLSIEAKPTYFDEGNVSASPTVRLTNESAFESATVHIPINESVATLDEENLSVYRWNGSQRDRWTAMETTFENGTAIAETDRFSYFTVLDTDEWVSATQAPTVNATSSPINVTADATNFTCSGACALENDTTLLVGGTPQTRKINISQGDRSIEVTPLQDGSRLQEFYDYGDFQLNTELPVAESDRSQLFFWSGPEGLSLVVVHDKPNDGSGGAVDLTFENLLNPDGSWVIRDDGPDFTRTGASLSEPHWRWAGSKTDGGAYRGGLNNRTITITPAFNEEATESASGDIVDWQALSGQATDPVNHTLNMSEPVTIDVPESVAANESTVTAGENGTASLEYALDASDGELAIRYQTEQTSENPLANATVVGPNGTTIEEPLNVGTVGTVEEGIDISQLSSGNATISIHAEGVDLRSQVLVTKQPQDTDGDGLRDSVENRTWRMTSGPGDTFRTSATDNDTDGDGLEDGAEVSFVERDVESREETVLQPVTSSNPNRVDTDQDSLTDYEETRVWNTSAQKADTDGDGFNDAVDPDPNLDSALPEVQVWPSEETWKVEAGDRSGISKLSFTAIFAVGNESNLTLEKRVVEANRTWNWSRTTPSYTYDLAKNFRIENGPDDRPPIGFIINATDGANNTRQITLVRNASNTTTELGAPKSRRNGALLDAAQVGLFAAAGETASGRAAVTGGTRAAGQLASARATATRLGAVGLKRLTTGFVILTAYTGTAGQGRISEPRGPKRFGTTDPVVPTVAAIATYTLGQTEVTLFEGFVEQRQGFVRGYGLALSNAYRYEQATVGSIINNPEQVIRNGNDGYIEGTHPSGDKILITLANGIVITVVAGEIIEDPNGNSVEIVREDEEKNHFIRDDSDHPNSWDEVEEAIKNPDEIWESGRRRYYAKYINGRWLVVRTHFSGVLWTVSTAVYQGPTYSDVTELLKEKGFNIPGDRVYEDR